MRASSRSFTKLPNILALAHRLRGRKAGQSRYPQILHDLKGEELTALGAKFIEDTRVHRGDAPFFIDKMPNNFRHIGLIHLILPNAKIIDARRAPMDCCFSGFKQLFAEGQEFTYGLTQIGRYYSDYIALMDHWNHVLPGKVLRIQHEDVLDDLEGQTRRSSISAACLSRGPVLSFTRPSAPSALPAANRSAARSIAADRAHGSPTSRGLIR